MADNEQEHCDKMMAGLKKIADDCAQIKHKTHDETVDKILEAMFTLPPLAKATLFTDDEAYKQVHDNQAFYSTLCSLYMSKKIERHTRMMLWVSIAIGLIALVNVVAFIVSLFT